MSLPHTQKLQATQTTQTAPLDLSAYFQQCYEENLAYFQQHHPELYTFALSHNPKNSVLGVSDAGYPTLIDIKTQNQLTEDDPRQQIAHYLENYVKSPEFMTYGPKLFPRNPVTSRTHLTQFINKLNDAVPATDKPCQITRKTPIPLAICFGQQLGHITELSAKTYNIRHIVIYEPDLDHFYASLFVQRYDRLSEPFNADNKSITFIVGDCPNRLCNSIYDFVRQNGYFLVANVLLLEPHPTERTAYAKQRYQTLAPRMSQGWGFFTDELRGLTQTLENGRQGLNIFAPDQSKPTPLADTPCYVIGNGPSLDRCIEFLKKHQENILIISAGTTIHTLLKNDIKPDLHVEIERAKSTYRHLAPLAANGSLEKIPLMTLNTVVPAATNLFSNAYTLLKEGDLGSEMLIENHYAPNAILPLSHPLVGNGATAIAIRLGCKKIFLMGMDLSRSESGQVHSQDSLYNDPEHPYQDKTRKFNYTTQGNLGGKVQTDQLFDSSRLSLELLIEAHPTRTFFNIGDGIRILGTTPLQGPEFIPVTDGHDIESNLNKTLENIASLRLSDPSIVEIGRAVAQNTSCLLHQIQQLLWRKKDASVETALTSFSDQISVLTHSTNQTAAPYRLLKGSLAYLQSQIIYNLLFITTQKARATYLATARSIFIKYLKSVEQQMHRKLSPDKLTP